MSLFEHTLPEDVLHVRGDTLYVQRCCLGCGVPTVYLAYALDGDRRQSERTLAGCIWHRLEPHCVFCCRPQ